MKRALGIILAAAFAVSAMAVPVAAASAPIDLAEVREGKVAVCHVPGGEDSIITGKGFGCENDRGGVIIVISENALKGHGLEV